MNSKQELKKYEYWIFDSRSGKNRKKIIHENISIRSPRKIRKEAKKKRFKKKNIILCLNS